MRVFIIIFVDFSYQVVFNESNKYKSVHVQGHGIGKATLDCSMERNDTTHDNHERYILVSCNLNLDLRRLERVFSCWRE